MAQDQATLLRSEDAMNKKRSAALSVAAAAAALAVGVVTPADGSPADAAHRHTIRVDSVITEVNFLDTGAAGASLGDQIVFSNKLLDGNQQVGHEGAVCTTVSLERTEAQCFATFSFPDGEITAQGLVVLGSMAPYAAPITGGSGAYQGADGELRVTPVSDTEGIQTLVLNR
jgi:hypothetical protein